MGDVPFWHELTRWKDRGLLKEDCQNSRRAYGVQCQLTYDVQEPLSSSRPVSDCIGCERYKKDQEGANANGNSLPLQPVPIMPPMVLTQSEQN
jgi:hypothetical protein